MAMLRPLMNLDVRIPKKEGYRMSSWRHIGGAKSIRGVMAIIGLLCQQ